MVSDELVVNHLRSASTSTLGRAVNQVRNHLLVIDEPTHLGGPVSKSRRPKRSWAEFPAGK